MNAQDSAYFRGREACAAQQPKSSNPHQDDEQLRAYWARGWMEEYKTLPPALQAVRDAKEASHGAEH